MSIDRKIPHNGIFDIERIKTLFQFEVLHCFSSNNLGRSLTGLNTQIALRREPQRACNRTQEGLHDRTDRRKIDQSKLADYIFNHLHSQIAWRFREKISVLSRSECQVIARHNIDILTDDFHISVRSTDRNTGKGIDIHLAQWRINGDRALLGRHGDRIKPILIRKLDSPHRLSETIFLNILFHLRDIGPQCAP